MLLQTKTKYLYLLSQKSNRIIKVLSDGLFIKPSNLIHIIIQLKKHQQLIIMATAMDQLQKINRFYMVYLFGDYNTTFRFYINVNTDRILPSIVNHYASAIWLEREVYDMYGIYFSSNSVHSDLRRILTDYHFKGHPLRKDYSLIGYSEKWYSYLHKGIMNKSDLSFDA